MLEGRQEVLDLMSPDSPFASGRPPKFIRGKLYKYYFETEKPSNWWRREYQVPSVVSSSYQSVFSAGRVLANPLYRQRPAGHLPHQPGVHPPGDGGGPPADCPGPGPWLDKRSLQVCAPAPSDLELRLAVSACDIVSLEKCCS